MKYNGRHWHTTVAADTDLVGIVSNFVFFCLVLALCRGLGGVNGRATGTREHAYKSSGNRTAESHLRMWYAVQVTWDSSSPCHEGLEKRLAWSRQLIPLCWDGLIPNRPFFDPIFLSSRTSPNL